MKKIYILFLFSLYIQSFSQYTVDSKILEVNWGGESEPDHLTKVGEKLFFSAEIAASFDGNGRELWVKDSPTSKSRIVKDIYQNGSGIYANSVFLDFNGVLLFSNSSQQLWRSDGTENGTYLLKTFSSNYSSQLKNPVIVNDKLYFSTSNNSSSELWVSDGTVEGTYLVKKFTSQFHFILGGLFSFKDKIYFTADDGIHGGELWRSDGTESGTEIAIDFYPGIQRGIFNTPIVYNDELIFLGARSSTENGIWKWNTDTNTIHAIKDLPSNYGGQFEPVEANNLLYFILKQPSQGYDIWSTDGTSGNTQQLSIGSTEYFIVNETLLKFKDQLHFKVSKNIGTVETWFLDLPTNTIKKLVSVIPSLENTALFLISSEKKHLLFRHQNGKYSVSDGTNAGTTTLTGIEVIANYSAYKFNFVDYFDRVVMNAKTPKHGVELYQYNIVNQTTTLLEDVNHYIGSTLLASETLNGKLIYFGNDYNHGLEVFVSDGTEEGTHLLKDLNPGEYNSVSTSENPLFFKHNNKLFYRCTDGTGFEPCVTDGTSVGTKILKNISPYNDSLNDYPNFIKFDNEILLFGATDGNSNSSPGTHLWRTDGTEVGTYELSGINLISRGNAVINGKAYYTTQNNLVNNTWKYSIAETDGTATGTKIFKTVLNGGNDNVAPIILGAVNNKMIYVYHHTPFYGSGEYKKIMSSDGINPDADVELGKFASVVLNSIVFKNKLYFQGYLLDDSSNRFRLFATDGTLAGTLPISNAFNSNQGIDLKYFECGNKLYVNVGNKIFVTDGEGEFLKLIDETTSKFQNLKCLSNHVFFADKKYDDNKIWISDGTLSGSKPLTLLVDGLSTSGTSYLYDIAVTDTQLFYHTFFYQIPEFRNSGPELFVADLSSINLSTGEVNLQRKEKAKSFVVYPNPVAGTLTISNSKNKTIQSVTLQTIDGKLLQTWSSNEAKLPLNLEKLTTGNYFLNISTQSGETEAYKIIKK